MEQKIKPAYLFVIVFFLLAGFASMAAVAKNDNAKNDSDKSDKSEKISQGEKGKDGQSINLKDYKKADVSKGETNAKVHKEKTIEVIENLEQVKIKTENAKTENSIQADIKNKVKKQIEEVAAEQESFQEKTVAAIEEVENDGNFKKFILGPDYKNLGQLRSELVHNRNQIRKLIQAIETLKINGEDTVSLELQLQTLTQERERIKSIITTNQEGFSLFGWVGRFLSNYEQSSINEEEEGELEDEVETVLSEADDSQESNDLIDEAENTDTSNSTTNTNVDATTDNSTTDTTKNIDDEVLQ